MIKNKREKERERERERENSERAFMRVETLIYDIIAVILF